MEIFAHRGLNHQAPENTMAAFRLAHESGLDWIETDVDILGDGTPVILHDSTLDRTTNRTGSIYNLTAADLSKISAGAHFDGPNSEQYAQEPIPTLDDLVDFLNETGMGCNLEIKSNEAGGEMSLNLLEAVEERCFQRLKDRSPERLLVSSFNHVLLYIIHQRHPEIATACLYTKDNLWPDALSVCELVGAKTIHPQNEGLTPEIIKHLKQANLTINVWTVNDPTRTRELKDLGADGVFTDIADEMTTALR